MNYRFLILLPTYKREEMVKTAIGSVLSQDYDNYVLGIIDDNAEATVCVPEDPRIKYILTGDSDEHKKSIGGSRHGEAMNFLLDNCPADIAIVLCDDDALIPGYLSKLNQFYHKSGLKYSYCHVRTYNPEKETPNQVGDRKNQFFTNTIVDVMPFSRVDASQVSWFISEDRFPCTQTRNLDAEMFRKLQNRYGICKYNGIDGQYKGIFPGQLGRVRYDWE